MKRWLVLFTALVVIGFLSCESPVAPADEDPVAPDDEAGITEEPVSFLPPAWLQDIWLTYPVTGAQFIDVSSNNLIWKCHSRW